jgi:hypothetical protein
MNAQLFFAASVFVCAAVCVVAEESIAQEIGEVRSSASYPETLQAVNRAAVRMDKLLNTYHWNTSIVYQKVFGMLGVNISEQFHSSIIRTDRNLVRDEHLLDVGLRHTWSEHFAGKGIVSSLILSDNKNIGINNALSYTLLGGVEYLPMRQISLTPLVGMRFDSQIGTKDKGVSYGLNVLADKIEFGGYTTTVRGTFQRNHLVPRILETSNDTLIIAKNFFEQTRNEFRFFYHRSRRDFYIAADTVLQRLYAVNSNIESRSENAFTFSDGLDYNIGTDILFHFEGNIFTRTIERNLQYRNILGTSPVFNTNITEFRIDGAGDVRYAAKDFSTSLRFLYQERDEEHGIQDDERILFFVQESAARAEERKNNHTKRIVLGGTVGIAISHSDSIVLSGSSSLLRYDTPSSLNDDDRDELFHIFHVTTFHRFSQYLSGQFTAEANLSHLVYLKRTRSADNAWNRIFRLSPRLVYLPSEQFISVNTFEVLANYTVYDFEFPGAPTQSHVFRQFGFMDSTTIGLTRRTALEWYSSLRLYERGELRWQEFTERPINYFEDRTLLGMVRYVINERLLLSCGIRYFRQARFRFVGTEKQQEFFLRSIGPVARIEWNVGDRTLFLFNGWYERLTQTAQPDAGVANMTMSLSVLL